MFDFVIHIRSLWEDDSPQWELLIESPSEQSASNSRMISLFALVRSVYDNLKFKRVGDRILYVPSNMDDTAWHSDVGAVIEKHFQNELSKMMHLEWDEFTLIWEPTEYESIQASRY